jgi:hypothetical protein
LRWTDHVDATCETRAMSSCGITVPMRSYQRGWEGQDRGGGGSGDAGCSTIICHSTIGTGVAHAGAKNCVRSTGGPVAPNSDVSWAADWSAAARSTHVLDPDAVLRCIGHAASVPWVHVQTATWEPAGSDQRVSGLKAAKASWPDSQTTTTWPRTRRTRVIENESSLIPASSVQPHIAAGQRSSIRATQRQRLQTACP